ncbi:MAG: polysaccharide deacetylase family protein [Betaproteobacteria bacterium]|nr:polysaccharide deacetylase family protein [Betaproteobacteria bacterium]
MFWFDRVVHLLLRSAVTSLRLDALGMTLSLPFDATTRRAMAIELLNRLKLASETERLLVMRQLEVAADVLVNEVESALSLPMTWAQVREMAQAGMEFGSHTVSHPILSAMARCRATASGTRGIEGRHRA